MSRIVPTPGDTVWVLAGRRRDVGHAVAATAGRVRGFIRNQCSRALNGEGTVRVAQIYQQIETP